MKPILGTFADPPGQARIDLPRLLETKLLLQAGSGFGKSWALRRILEQTAGQVQHIVVDPEGEFATLRERHGYVLAAVNGGDVVAHPRTAGLLARRLVEMKVSAVLDISELKKAERRRFVRLFLEELMGLPRAMWTPLLVAIDEAHEFAPEKDESESLTAVIDLATRGRKRGFSMLAATQRIGKFSKDTAAELHNKLVGFTSLDIDVKRAAFELGMTPAQALAELRGLEPGDFYAIGPALTPTYRRLRIGDVETTHPRPGTRKLQAPPKPTAEIIAVLPKLADLPKEAEQEQKTVEDLRRELASVRRELTLAKRPATPASKGPSTEDLRAARVEGIAAGTKQACQKLRGMVMKLGARVENALLIQNELLGFVEAGEKAAVVENPVRRVFSSPPDASATMTPGPRAARARQIDATAAPRAGNGSLPPGERAVLAACIQYPDGLMRPQLTVLTGYKRSSRDAYIFRLREKGYVETAGDRVTATPDGMATLPDAEPLPTGDALREFWRARLPEGERKILEVLCEAYPDPVARTELDERTGYRRSSRDAYLSRLGAKQLIEEPERGQVRANKELFA